MFDTIGSYEPVIFTIHSGSEDSEEDSDCEFQMTRELSFEEFCSTVERSGRSWEETHAYMCDYYKKLSNRRDSSTADILDTEQKIRKRTEERKHLDTIRDQILATVRYIERKAFLTWKATEDRLKAFKQKLQYKQLLLTNLNEAVERNKELQAQVEALHKTIYLKLKRIYCGHRTNQTLPS